MEETNKEIGLRIKEFREVSEVSVNEMISFLNIDEDTYIAYEEGEKDIPASLLYEIAQKFNVDMSLLLTGEESRMHIFSVTRKGAGTAVDRRKKYKYEHLADKFLHKKAEPFIVTVEPKNKKPSTDSHPGQEFNYVLAGSIKMYIHEQEIILNAGDSIFFDSSYEHAMEALNNEDAKFLAVIM